MTRALPVPIARRAQLGLCLSPYHLTTRELPAMLACLLGDRIVTPLPVERDGADSGAEALAALMDAWSWSAPMWEQGLIGSALHGDDARADIDNVMREIASSDDLAPLHPFVRLREREDPRRWLERMAADLMRGGPDPGLCVPISAAMDRFAARRGVAVVRSAPSSLAQQAEDRLATRLFAFAMPVLAEAPADRLDEARAALAPQLDALRVSMSEAFAVALSGADADPAPIRSGAGAYARAYEGARDELLPTPDDPDDPRVVEAVASVTGAPLPQDAGLRPSLTAVGRARGVRTPRSSPVSPPPRDAAVAGRQNAPLARGPHTPP